ncbi:hypothetical protein ACT8ZR_18300 [Neobacillus sp. M.A.Huq-85]
MRNDPGGGRVKFTGINPGGYRLGDPPVGMTGTKPGGSPRPGGFPMSYAEPKPGV